MNLGDYVEKIGGDYTFVGIVVSKFKKLSGLERYVVEDDRGVLHVYSEKVLKLVDIKENILSDVNITNIPTIPVTGLLNFNERNRLLGLISGSNSLFVKYLSSSVIFNGKGTIKNCKSFQQYTEDIGNISANILNDWPEGFYRNNKTMNTQLLIKTDKFIVYVDGLPGYLATVNVFNYDFKTLELDTLSIEMLDNVVSNLENSLRSISLLNNFE